MPFSPTCAPLHPRSPRAPAPALLPPPPPHTLPLATSTHYLYLLPCKSRAAREAGDTPHLHATVLGGLCCGVTTYGHALVWFVSRTKTLAAVRTPYTSNATSRRYQPMTTKEPPPSCRLRRWYPPPPRAAAPCRCKRQQDSYRHGDRGHYALLYHIVRGRHHTCALWHIAETRAAH